VERLDRLGKGGRFRLRIDAFVFLNESLKVFELLTPVYAMLVVEMTVRSSSLDKLVQSKLVAS
jgi:hypothetical protein